MERPNRGRSILLQAMVIATAAVFWLLWLAAYPSPAAVLLVGLLILSYFNYFISGRDVLYPAFTFTAIWAAVIIIYLFCPIEIRAIGWRTIAVLLGGTTCFSIGSLIGNRPLSRREYTDRRNEGAEYRGNPQARLVLLGYTVMTVPMVVLDTQKIVGEQLSFSPTFFIALRSTMNYIRMVEGTNPYSNRLVSTSFMITGLTFFVFVMEEKRKWANVLFASCFILFSFLSSGRGFLMQALCGWLCLVLLRRKDRSFQGVVRWSAAAIVAVIILMTTITFLTKSETQGEGGAQVATDLTIQYIAGPIAAFDYAVYNPGDFRDQPAAVLAGVLTPLSKLGLIHYTPPNAFDESVFVPFGTNVYTAFKPYYEDFGVTGCFASFALIGLVEGFVFYTAVRGSHVAAFVLAYLSASLMLSTFDDLYHFLMGYLYLSAYLFAYYVLLNRLRINGPALRIHLS